MAMHISNKRGQTLVEVVVALGILAIVFAGTVTLIVNVLKLNLAAREKTHAVAFAQQGIANALQGLGSSCTAGTYTSDTNSNLGGVTFNRSVRTTRVFWAPGGEPTINANGAFVLITSTVRWNNNVDSYEIKEIKRFD